MLQKKITFLYLLICLGFMQLNAQIHEVGVSAGMANYRGEIASIINYESPGIYAGGFYRFNANKYLSLRLNGYMGQVSGNDANSEDSFDQIRNHSFTTLLWEFSTQIEYNFLDFRGDKYNDQNWTPYVFGGLGIFKMDPKENLQPTYETLNMSIPLGVGIKLLLSDKWNFGAEFGSRITFTDYLDDLGVETNQATIGALNPKYYTGNPNNNDFYFFTGVSLSYVIPYKAKDCPVKLPR